MQIPLINEHLFCKYFVRQSFGNATKGFATYGCFHPCLFMNINHMVNDCESCLNYNVWLPHSNNYRKLHFLHLLVKTAFDVANAFIKSNCIN